MLSEKELLEYILTAQTLILAELMSQREGKKEEPWGTQATERIKKVKNGHIGFFEAPTPGLDE